MHYKEFLKARYIKFSGGISSKMFVLYFCTLCHDANQGIKSLNAAMDSLLTLPKSFSESCTTVHSENSAEVSPLYSGKHCIFRSLPWINLNLSTPLRCQMEISITIIFWMQL